MAKLGKGRCVGKRRGDDGFGLHTLEQFSNLSLSDLYRHAAHYEAELCKDPPDDHPAWLQKRLDALRTLIRQKEKAMEHRARQR